MRAAGQASRSTGMGVAAFLALCTLLAARPGSIEARATPPSGERLLAGVAFLVRDAAHPAWSTQGDWIAYDKPGHDGLSDLYVAHPDGAYDRCLTCDLRPFGNRHAGNADWHPSGRYLVFQAERPFPGDGEPLPFLAVPGRSRESSLWVISVDGDELYQLTGQREISYPAHSPRFSFEGDRLAWSERLASGGTWGDWVIRVGEFVLGRGGVRLRDVATYEPGAQKAFYEVGSFTPDDKGLLFAANPIEGQPIDGLDLYVIDLASKQVRQLTKSLTTWDRYPIFAPVGDVVAWSSGEALRPPPRPVARTDRTVTVALDLWLGALDGGWSRRLTGFNDPLSDEYLGPVMVGPSAFSPSGDRLVTTVTPLEDAAHSDLFLLTLAQPFGAAAPSGR